MLSVTLCLFLIGFHCSDEHFVLVCDRILLRRRGIIIVQFRVARVWAWLRGGGASRQKEVSRTLFFAPITFSLPFVNLESFLKREYFIV